MIHYIYIATQQQVNLNDLSTEQLNQLRGSLNDELQLLTSNMTNIRSAMNRYTTSHDSLNIFNESNTNKNIFVPLTSSMYIPGKLNNINSVLVDIGTGYYIEKSIQNAQKYVNDKIVYLGKSVDNIANAALQKRRDLDTITIVLQTKLSQLRAQQAQQLDNIGKIE